jgi:hypothetical protein
MRDVADDRGLDWEYTKKVLSSRDLDEWMRLVRIYTGSRKEGLDGQTPRR